MIFGALLLIIAGTLASIVLAKAVAIAAGIAVFAIVYKLNDWRGWVTPASLAAGTLTTIALHPVPPLFRWEWYSIVGEAGIAADVVAVFTALGLMLWIRYH